MLDSVVVPAGIFDVLATASEVLFSTSPGRLRPNWVNWRLLEGKEGYVVLFGRFGLFWTILKKGLVFGCVCSVFQCFL